jgi:hypothetical protein
MGWASAGAWAYLTTEYGGLVFVYMGATRLQFDLGRPVQGSNKVHQAALSHTSVSGRCLSVC